MHILPSEPRSRIRAGIPTKVRSYEGSQALVLLDVPHEPVGPLIPVLVPPVAGKPKEEMGAFADALVSTNRFVVVRPPFLNSGDEAPGTMEHVAILPEELRHWGRWLQSPELREILREQYGVEEISTKTACCAASLGATLAVHAQAAEKLFDAMVLFSYVPNYSEFVTRKLNIHYEELVARTWRYRLKDDPDRAGFYAVLARRIAEQSEADGMRQRWLLLAERLENLEAASLRDFALMLEGVPLNAYHGFSKALRGVWGFEFDLSHNIEKSLEIDLPISFIIGLQDDFFAQETMDQFLVAARSTGKVRRAIRLEDADHRMRPVTALERGMPVALQYLANDLDEEIEFNGISLAHVAMRRFQEVRGLAQRHAANLGIPAALMQKFMLNRGDLTSSLKELLSRPDEVATFILLLHEDFKHRDDGTTILNDLDSKRLAQIFDAAIEPRHYASIAAGISMVADEAYVLFSRDFVQTANLSHLDGILRELSEQGDELVSVIRHLEPEILDALGRRRAAQQAKRAALSVPAYRSLIGGQVEGNLPEDLSEFPLTSKADYVERYPIESRCVEGTLPHGGLIEESGGSSGTPTDWVRCHQEDAYMAGGTRMFFDYLFKSSDSRRIVILSTFSQGTWASSSRLTVLGRFAGIVKDIGTDAARVVETIKRMGTAYHYVVAAYPPFFRELLITGEMSPGFSWRDYKIDVYHGGEGYTASWRRFVTGVLSSNARVISGYGASDLEVSMAFETDSSLSIRSKLEHDRGFRVRLLGTERMPVFLGQYNPVDTYLEVCRDESGRSGIVATVNNPCSWQPRVRYQIGDEGGIISYWSAAAASNAAGLNIDWGGELNLPFLFLFGRLDGTVSLDGANIYPNQVQEALFLSKEISSLVKSFQLKRIEGRQGEVEFQVLLETFSPIEGDRTIEVTQGAASDAIREHLCSQNPDYREALTHNEALRPVVRLVKPGALGLDGKIKHQYIGE